MPRALPTCSWRRCVRTVTALIVLFIATGAKAAPIDKIDSDKIERRLGRYLGRRGVRFCVGEEATAQAIADGVKASLGYVVFGPNVDLRFVVLNRGSLQTVEHELAHWCHYRFHPDDYMQSSLLLREEYVHGLLTKPRRWRRYSELQQSDQLHPMEAWRLESRWYYDGAMPETPNHVRRYGPRPLKIRGGQVFFEADTASISAGESGVAQLRGTFRHSRVIRPGGCGDRGLGSLEASEDLAGDLGALWLVNAAARTEHAREWWGWTTEIGSALFPKEAEHVSRVADALSDAYDDYGLNGELRVPLRALHALGRAQEEALDITALALDPEHPVAQEKIRELVSPIVLGRGGLPKWNPRARWWAPFRTETYSWSNVAWVLGY